MDATMKETGSLHQLRMNSKEKKGVAVIDQPLLNHILEAATGFEPVNRGFADRCLTTWLCRRTFR